jgi:ABC-2 type transport system permease protein
VALVDEKQRGLVSPFATLAASRPWRLARLLFLGWLLYLKILNRSGFFLLVSILQPIIFASIAFFLFRTGGREHLLLYAAVGTGLMGIWSSTLFGAGGAIQWQRWEGTLEALIVAPPSFLLVLFPLTLATSTIGLYSVTATLVWGRLLFGIAVTIAHPVLFVASLLLTVLALGVLGLVLASTFILYRQGSGLANLLEYPVWLVTGLLVPIALLPTWTRPISWALAPTWGVRAVRRSAIGGDPRTATAMTLALTLVYFALSAVCMRYFERLARERATLALS